MMFRGKAFWLAYFVAIWLVLFALGVEMHWKVPAWQIAITAITAGTYLTARRIWP